MKIEFFSSNEKKILKTPRKIKNSKVEFINSKWSIIVSVKKDKESAKRVYNKKINSLGAKLLEDKILLTDFLILKEKAKKKLQSKCVVVKLKKDRHSLVAIQKSFFDIL